MRDVTKVPKGILMVEAHPYTSHRFVTESEMIITRQAQKCKKHQTLSQETWDEHCPIRDNEICVHRIHRYQEKNKDECNGAEMLPEHQCLWLDGNDICHPVHLIMQGRVMAGL